MFSGEPHSTRGESELELSLLHSGIIPLLVAPPLVSHCFHPLLLYQHIQKRERCCANWDPSLGRQGLEQRSKAGKFCTTTVSPSEAANQSQLVRHCFLSAQALHAFYNIKKYCRLNFHFEKLLEI